MARFQHHTVPWWNLSSSNGGACHPVPPDGAPQPPVTGGSGWAALAAAAGGTPIARGDLLGLDCEILVPAAQPDVVTTDNAGKISARVVLEGANIPGTEKAEAELAERGVLCVPDVVANAGGVICAAAEYRDAGHAEAVVTGGRAAGRALLSSGSCRTASQAIVPLRSRPGFSLEQGGRVAGRYYRPPFTGCGWLTPLVNLLATGSRNAAVVDLVPATPGA
jgi:hypothetical protein